MSHKCHALGCDRHVPPRMLMCPKHWRMVPADLKADIWAYYRPGQEMDKDPSDLYLRVQGEAVAFVAAKEGFKPRDCSIHKGQHHICVFTHRLDVAEAKDAAELAR